MATEKQLKIIRVTHLDDSQKTALADLWNGEYPEQLKFENPLAFKDYLSGLTDAVHYLQLDIGQQIVGWAFKFLRGNDTWFGIILNSKIHQQGFGKLLIEHLKTGEKNLYGWAVDHDHYYKANSEPYRSPLKFYLKNGFTVDGNQRLKSEVLSAVMIHWSVTPD